MNKLGPRELPDYSMLKTYSIRAANGLILIDEAFEQGEGLEVGVVRLCYD